MVEHLAQIWLRAGSMRLKTGPDLRKRSVGDTGFEPVSSPTSDTGLTWINGPLTCVYAKQ